MCVCVHVCVCVCVYLLDMNALIVHLAVVKTVVEVVTELAVVPPFLLKPHGHEADMLALAPSSCRQRRRHCSLVPTMHV